MKYLLIILLLCGCYSERKARDQFSKAAIAYPKLPAEYCAITYPVKDSTIRDTLITTDTVLIEGKEITDTVFGDTIRITTIKYLPGKVITNTFHITDTIYQENTAALKACQLDNSTMADLLKKETGRADKYQAQATKRGWIMWGLILLIITIIGTSIYLKSKKINV